MSEVLGRLNRTIAARGPDSLWVESRDALAAAYQTISNLHEKIAVLEKPWWRDPERDHRGVRERCIADGNPCGPECKWDGYGSTERSDSSS